jgi:hypothetical protein
MVALLIVGLVNPARAQTADSTRVGGFPSKQFMANDETARWLAQYDAVAWVTSDLVTALPKDEFQRLGQEWFCFENSGTWHAVYGRYDTLTDRYAIGVHYRSDGSRFVRTTDAVDTTAMLELARAVHFAEGRSEPAIGNRVRYNVYVRRLGDRRLEVWLLPAWQPNGVLLYGVELRQTLDSSGRALVDSAYMIGGLRGIRPDTTRTLNIVDDQHEVPTVGETFFAWAYHKYFAHIRIFSRGFVTELAIDPTTKKPLAWLHAARHSTPDSGSGPNAH